MSQSKIILYPIDVITRGLAAFTLLKAFPYLFQVTLFGAWDLLIWFYPIVWLALLFLSVHPNFIMNKINTTKITSWFLVRIPALCISIIGVWFFFKSGV